jgi:XTP/dITP diphosphohydrolase
MNIEMELLVATHNEHKKEEIQQILEMIVLKSLTDYNIHEEIVEDGDSFHANALIKAKYCFEKQEFQV